MSLALKNEIASVQDFETKLAQKSEAPCECFHDYAGSSVAHYLSLPTVNVYSGDTAPLENGDNADACFRRASWIATIKGEAPEGFVPPSARLLCNWCKDHWQAFGSDSNRFEPLL